MKKVPTIESPPSSSPGTMQYCSLVPATKIQEKAPWELVGLRVPKVIMPVPGNLGMVKMDYDSNRILSLLPLFLF